MEGHKGGSRSIPTVHPCSQSGRRLWVARKALHLHEPNHEGNGRSIHNYFTEDRAEWQKELQRHCKVVYTDMEETKEEQDNRIEYFWKK